MVCWASAKYGAMIWTVIWAYWGYTKTQQDFLKLEL